MMIYDGTIKISNKIVINSYLTKKNFENSSLYNNQDLSKFFWVRDNCIIQNKEFFVGFLFRENYISQVQLYCIDKSLKKESQRKDYNDEFITKLGGELEYEWGNIKSIENKREKISLIIINYFRK